MIRAIVRRSIFAGVLLTGAISLPACGDGDRLEESADAGTIRLPLTAEANGHLYRLNNANVLISGPTSLWLFADPNQAELTATLTTGGYFAQLFPGWSLERDDGSGNFSPVQADLVSSSFVEFVIFQGTTSTIAYRFETDGVIVTVGSGDLRIAIDVDERSPACTPFGEECGAGSWCPPSGLTGAPRACIGEGALPVGAACQSPLECVANASCFDLGMGPVCVELCPAEEFDAPCASGGTCVPRAEDYGLCEPSAAE